jgi:hypothetical protein
MKSFLITLIILLLSSAANAQNGQLMHYWNFNNSTSQTAHLSSSFSISETPRLILATIVAPTEIQLSSNTGQDFSGLNNRLGADTGSHLRFNNPIGSALTVPLPTTGYENVVFKFETRRSGSGANTQNIAYTLDGQNFVAAPMSVLTVTEVPDLYSIDFSAIPAAGNNANFAIRFTFDDTNEPKNLAGNNRFDNMSLEGSPLPNTNLPPTVVAPIADMVLIAGAGTTRINLNSVFSDPDNSNLTFSVSTDRETPISATIEAHELVISSSVAGSVALSVTANDGVNPSVATDVHVLFYPQAFPLITESFEFMSWSNLETTGSYPANMLFLQSNKSDPRLNDDLVFSYHVPDNEYAESDLVSLGYPYRLESRTRINGLGADGISFINTGRSRDVGGALVALDTRGVARIYMSFLAGTVLPNLRIYAIRAQYRVGFDGPWLDVNDSQGNPVEYIRNATAGHTQRFTTLRLPSAMMEQPYVQLLFRYYYINEVTSGARAMLRLDDILLERVLTTSVETSEEMPLRTELAQNWPNPFNPTTQINFTIGAEFGSAASTRLAVYDLLGREVAVLSQGVLPQGNHTVNFDASGLASGIYLYRLEVNGTVQFRRMTLLK